MYERSGRVKRSGPPKRNTPLKRTGGPAPKPLDPGHYEAWRRSADLARGKAPKRRSGPKKRSKGVTPAVEGGYPRAEWYGVELGRCEACGERPAVTRHHVVYEQHVKKHGGDHYDPANQMGLCVKCHRAHHDRVWVLPVSLIRDRTIEFGVQLLGPALYDYLARRYSGASADPRLRALIEPPAGYSGTREKEESDVR